MLAHDFDGVVEYAALDSFPHTTRIAIAVIERASRAPEHDLDTALDFSERRRRSAERNSISLAYPLEVFGVPDARLGEPSLLTKPRLLGWRFRSRLVALEDTHPVPERYRA